MAGNLYFGSDTSKGETWELRKYLMGKQQEELYADFEKYVSLILFNQI